MTRRERLFSGLFTWGVVFIKILQYTLPFKDQKKDGSPGCVV